MPIIRFTNNENFNELSKLQNLIDNFFSNPYFEENAKTTRTVYPAINLFETTNDLLIKTNLPGLKASDLEISLKEEAVILKGKKEFPNVENFSFHKRERDFGEFNRIIDLPFEVDPERAVATMKNGVLTIKIAKKEHVKPRQITIREE